MDNEYTSKMHAILDTIDTSDGWTIGTKQDEYGFNVTIRKSTLHASTHDILHTRHLGISFRFSNEDIDTYQAEILSKQIQELLAQ